MRSDPKRRWIEDRQDEASEQSRSVDEARASGQPRYVISVAAQILGVHPQTLRLYEREGLVEPGRTGGKIRLYSDYDLERVRSIMRLTSDLGVNLAGAEALLNMRERMMQMRREMEQILREMETQLRELRRELDVE